MRKYDFVEITEVRSESTEVEVACNKCGKTKQLSGEDYEREWQANEFQSFYARFGYGSRYDMERWSFDLCEDCLTELIRTFKFVPKGFGEDSCCATYPQKMFEEWKETGVINLEAGMTAEEISENGGSIYAIDDNEE